MSAILPDQKQYPVEIEMASRASRSSSPSSITSNTSNTTRTSKTVESYFSSLSASFSWAASRAREIPFLATHPSVLIDKYHRKCVRDAMTKQTPIRVRIRLSKLLPAHPLEENQPALEKNHQRILLLQSKKRQFNDIHTDGRLITQEFIEGIMESTSPIQLAYDQKSGNCIAFDGNSRLIALKRFYRETYPAIDPELEMEVYKVAAELIEPAMPKRDYSFESSPVPAESFPAKLALDGF